MTQEQKDLLLKDLSGRLPYGVKCKYYNVYDGEYNNGTIIGFERQEWMQVDGKCIHIEDIKPYLFPLSSMTEEQKREYQYITERWMYDSSYSIGDSIDYLTANKFDYRGLIPMGLAIDATGLNIY